MNIYKFRFAVLFAIVFFAGVSSSIAYGAAPSVTSFTAAPQSVSYGFSTLLSWVTDSAAGVNLYFTCPAGVTIKKDDGSTFPCNAKQAIGSSPSDSASFFIANVTGNSIVLPVKVTPKDSNGTDYDGAASTINLYVGAVPFPISDFIYSTTSPAASNTPITLTWTGLEIQGANLQFDCKDGITIYSTNPSVAVPLDCGNIAYPSGLNPSGSASVYFVNANPYNVEETVRVFPAISAGIYDATHANSVTFTVFQKAAPSLPVISGFTSSQTLLASGQSINFSWVGSNTPGVNFQMPCSSAISWNSVVASTTAPLLCGQPAFVNAQPALGVATMSFINNSTSAQPVSISIYPQNLDGTYDATRGRVINLLVLEPGHVEAPAAAAPAPISNLVSMGISGSVPGVAQATSTTGIKAVHTVTFSLNLRLGSRSSQVSALQSFLKQDNSLYPEGLVTGYMGPASAAAIKRFQVRYGVAKQGDAGYGEVGPKTRAKLNSLQNF